MLVIYYILQVVLMKESQTNDKTARALTLHLQTS